MGLPNIGNVAKKTETAPYTIHDMADDIIGLMDCLGIDRAHLFGISMGGMIGQVLAASHGGRVSSLFSVMSSSSRQGLPAATAEAALALVAENDPEAGNRTGQMVDFLVRFGPVKNEARDGPQYVP